MLIHTYDEHLIEKKLKKIKCFKNLPLALMFLLSLSACKENKQVEDKAPKTVEIKKEMSKRIQPERDTIYSLPPARKKPLIKKVVVKEGEWLYDISRREYGNSRDWIKIYNANKEQIKNPDIIFPNQSLIIPD